MHDKLLESALGIGAPRSVKSVEFDAAAKRLTVLIAFAPGTCTKQERMANALVRGLHGPPVR